MLSGSARAVFGESDAFHAAKTDAIQRLMPYTNPGAVEAAICLIRSDGELYDFKEGSLDCVALNIPHEECAIFHSHSNDSPQGHHDFYELLTHSQVRDSFVVGRTRLYRLYRSYDNLRDYLSLTEDLVEDRQYKYCLAAALSRISLGEDVDSEEDETQVLIDASRRLAEHFGLIFVVEELGYGSD